MVKQGCQFSLLFIGHFTYVSIKRKDFIVNLVLYFCGEILIVVCHRSFKEIVQNIIPSF
jgi:hypothetical protein